MTAARRGRRSSPAFPTARRSTPFARIRRRRGCCSPAPSATSTCRSTTAANWQSLRLNMPVTSVRDIIVKDDDLVAGDARARVLDSRRHHAAAADRRGDRQAQTRRCSSRPTAWRVRWNTSTDMPWPKEEPTGPEPAGRGDHQLLPEGRRGGPVTLEILRAGRAARAALFEHRPAAADSGRRRPRRCRSTGIGRRSRSRRPPACIASSGTCTTSRSRRRGGGGRGGRADAAADPGDPVQHGAGADHARGSHPGPTPSS